MLLMFGMLIVYVNIAENKEGGRHLTFPEFEEKLDAGEIKEVSIKGSTISGTLMDDAQFVTTGPDVAYMEVVYNELVEHNITPVFEAEEDASLLMGSLFTFVPLIIMVLLFFWFMRNLQSGGGRAMNFGKARARIQSEGAKRVTFQDVAGVDEVKEELGEIVEFLKNPRKFTRLGGKIPKGVLLMGPPGTGKTLLARAVAGEAGVPFFSISGSDFVEMFVGVGASRVRDLFEQGKKQAPCIIFIDEIDAVGRKRGAGMGGGNDEREQTLNQLLVEMDGFEGTEGVIIVAATNRADVLDPALLRPGRFDRRVSVPNPDYRGREAILKVHVRRIPLADDVDLETIAKSTPGYSGADLSNLCNEAALHAARRDGNRVNMKDFMDAREKISMGPERRSMVMPESEKRNTAFHEAGHAIVAHLLPGHDPVLKVTIVPRGRALGLTWVLPQEDRRLAFTKEEYHKRLAMMLAGRAGEQLAFGTYTSGAYDDIKRATGIARSMVTGLGMSEELGPVNWGTDEGDPFMGNSFGSGSEISEATSQRIDNEVRRIVESAYMSAISILQQNRHVLDKVAEALIEVESLDQKEFSDLVASAGPVVPSGFAEMGI